LEAEEGRERGEDEEGEEGFKQLLFLIPPMGTEQGFLSHLNRGEPVL
jgi:hypothetical protein